MLFRSLPVWATLFPPPPATGGMKERARYVYELLGQHPAGLTAAQVGVRLHVHLGKPCRCGSDQPCKWSSADATSVLKSLRKRGLVKQLRDKSGRWALRGNGTRPASQLHPDTDPFPEGF